MPLPVLIVLLIVAIIVVPATTGSLLATVIVLVAILVASPVVRAIRKARYFASEHFQTLKSQISSLVAEHNAVVGYVAEIRAQGSFELGSSSTGQHAHLASFQNTSAWKYRRDRNVPVYAPHVYNTSLQVVRNASVDPLKYVMKYFSIKADKETLADVQRVADSISRLEEAVANVRAREADITRLIDPPAFILKHYSEEFWSQVGVHLSPIQVPYPLYKFQYTSAGGNSSQESNVQLDTRTLEALSAVLVDKIRWTKSAAGQRALMTTALRRRIKERDGYACRKCRVSVATEPHLLLEVDHIMPVSRGGMSVPENLQTLCWKCNRSKGAKVVS